MNGKTLSLGLFLAAAGCARLPREEPGRPPLLPDGGMARELEPRHAALRFEIEEAETAPSFRRQRFRFQAYGHASGDYRIVAGEYYQTLRVAGGQPAPLLLMSPILAGPVDDYLDCRFFSEAACEAGMSAFFLLQESLVLAGERDAMDLEARLRENIADNRLALDLLCSRPEVDAKRLGSVGISMGAIKNVVLIACEPRLRANVLGLAGADLAEVLRTTREPLLLEYLKARRERDGLEPEEVAREFDLHFRSEPAVHARAIDNGRVLLMLGRLDDKVPYACGLRLREELGNPETYLLPLGHYTAVLAAPWAARTAMEWLQGRFQGQSRTP